MNAYQVISERLARSGIEYQVKAIAGGAVFLVRRGEQKRAFHVNDVVAQAPGCHCTQIPRSSYSTVNLDPAGGG